MKVQLLKTLGTRNGNIPKGKVFDTLVEPIPEVIHNEIALQTGTVQVISKDVEVPSSQMMVNPESDEQKAQDSPPQKTEKTVSGSGKKSSLRKIAKK